VLKHHSLLTLALTLIVGFSFIPGLFALNNSNGQGNKATFETLEETRVSSPAAIGSQGSGKGTFKSHPVLDSYPKGTTYVYRSANLWGGRGNRLNTNILVFAEKSFQDKMEGQFKETDLQFMYLTSAYDLQPKINPEDGSLSSNSQVVLNKFMLFNKMNQIGYDFRAHPKCGFKADA
jgi:hypothetical protein